MVWLKVILLIVLKNFKPIFETRSLCSKKGAASQGHGTQWRDSGRSLGCRREWQLRTAESQTFCQTTFRHLSEACSEKPPACPRRPGPPESANQKTRMLVRFLALRPEVCGCLC